MQVIRLITIQNVNMKYTANLSMHSILQAGQMVNHYYLSIPRKSMFMEFLLFLTNKHFLQFDRSDCRIPKVWVLFLF